MTRAAEGGAPPSFDAALAALDYQPVDVRDNGTHVYELLGLDDVRAAHAEALATRDARIATLEAERVALIDSLAWTAQEMGVVWVDQNRDVWIESESGRHDDEDYSGYRAFVDGKPLPTVWEDFDQAYDEARAALEAK